MVSIYDDRTCTGVNGVADKDRIEVADKSWDLSSGILLLVSIIENFSDLIFLCKRNILRFPDNIYGYVLLTHF